MPWGIDQIENVLLAVVRLVDNANRLRLDRNSALSLEIHVI